MIVGNGMLANAFREAGYGAALDVIFASGVSNSQCTNTALFERERALLEKTLLAAAADSRVVYFGTCSVQDPAQQHSPYVAHKLNMESLALSHPRGIVFRLPQVAGPNAPGNTLLTVLCNSIRSNEPITAWRNASRNIVDLADVVQVISFLLRSGAAVPKIVNVANPRSSSVAEIIASAEKALNASALVIWVSEGASYEIDVSYVQPVFDSLGIDFDYEYLVRVIRRYYL
ncbi:MAG: NAD-dependent epimerase/dehydratase family protein [Casimicrobium sp.]